MPDVLERLKSDGNNGSPDRALLDEAVGEIAGLRKRRDELEMVLLMLVRTGWPWQEDGTPNGILPNCKDGYAAAIQEAKELLGLDHLSMITRTEPKT
ncbi:MAG: hypothetical protein CXR31_09550 [Geobacter sp.]|nr:MAG: hypothetical protein CXR31_09550 [Geobacter sp.]